VHAQLPLSSTFINVRYTDQIVLSVIWGSILGYGFRHLMKFCERNDLIDRQSYVAQYISLALLTVGTTSLLGPDDLLASFACGTAFAWDGFFNKQTEASVFSSVIDLLLNTAAFVYVGAWMPFDSFSDKALSLSVGRLICVAVLVLLLRRLPIILGLFKWIPDIKSLREALFSGHFGPIGIGELRLLSHPRSIAHMTSQVQSLYPPSPPKFFRGRRTRLPTKQNTLRP
jgi:NhaP-type Na+/H+ or K+/H+ antiporter